MRNRSVFIVVVILVLAAGQAIAQTVLVQPAADGSVANLDPAWSPDGRSIAYVRYACAPASAPGVPAASIHVASLVGGAWRHRELLRDADSPAWSPDSKRIACHSGGLVLVDVATGKTRRLVSDKNQAVQIPIAWSPNGLFLLYAMTWPDKKAAYVMNVKTGANVGGVVGIGGAWTNAGKLVAWTQGTVEAGLDAAGIRLVDLGTGKSVALAKGTWPEEVFVTKGDAVAYVRISNVPPKGEGLYRLNLKNGQLGKIQSLRAEQVVWSRDGARFASVAKLIPTKGAPPEMNLYLGNTKDWQFKVASKGLATPDGDVGSISWSPNGKSIVCSTGDGGLRIVKL